VIGHRGVAAQAPENTLAGLRRAKELGCRWVEFDVRLTADGMPILLHDDRLERTTNGFGDSAALPLAAVREYDAGRWFGPSFIGERVPTLEETVAALAALGLGANVELKAARGRAAVTGRSAAELLARLWPTQLPAVLVSSFLETALMAAREVAPQLARGLLFRSVPRDWRARVEALGCRTVHADHRRLHPAIVAEIRNCGYPVLAYTVNDAARAAMLYSWGVASVFSDIPHLLIDASSAGTRPGTAS
jgi:glycerophosphoryl diester phosphodiesterase